MSEAKIHSILFLGNLTIEGKTLNIVNFTKSTATVYFEYGIAGPS